MSPFFAMFSSIRAALNRTSKTSMARNGCTIPRRQKRGLNFDNSSPITWTRLDKHNNRASSTIHGSTKPETAKFSLVARNELAEFMAVFPDVVRDLTDAGRQIGVPEVTQRHAELLRYTVPNGRKYRGQMVLAAYKTFEKEENLTAENISLAYIMGWCVEMWHSFFQILDDVVDQSETRRGVPCWYRKERVGLNAITDALLLEQSLYTLLRKHFSTHECYVPTMQLFHDVTMKTSMGQCLDCSSCKDGKPNFDQFTMNKYNSLTKYKTAYSTFTLPVVLGMYMANIYDAEMHRQAKNILQGIGQFFQIENDFLDCFGDPESTSKGGNDVRSGKCTWLAVMALQRANPAQRRIMEEHYGRPDNEAVTIIQDLYEELDLPKTYAIYKEESFNMIRTHIQQHSEGLPRGLFFKILEKIYGMEC